MKSGVDLLNVPTEIVQWFWILTPATALVLHSISSCFVSGYWQDTYIQDFIQF
jgi:hypothetical protein